jgi:NitT/TauT family transport system substrate-binding protein
MVKHWLLQRVIVLLVLLLGSSCTPVSPPLRLGINLWPGYDFLYLAQQKGFFAAEGITVELVEFMSLGDSRRAFERHHVDVMGATVLELLLSDYYSSRAPQAFMVVDFSDGGDVLIAQPGVASLARSPKPRIGLEPASSDLLLLHVALEQVKLPLSAVEIVPLPQNRLLPAFKNGEIDAAVSYAPTSLSLLKAGGKILFSSAQSPAAILDVLVADAQTVKNRPAELAAVVRAFYRAVAFAKAHPDAAYAIMAAREQLSVAEFRQTLDGIRLVPLAEQTRLLTSSFPQAIGRVEHVLRNTQSLAIGGHPNKTLHTLNIVQMAQHEVKP